jgi:hypothetical protein
VDGTVFVGSYDGNYDGNLYAVAADTGSEEWAFETGGRVSSSPTVVDGTVFVGSGDDNLYAVDADVSGSSEGSRVLLGTEGHHGDWRYAGQSIDITPSDTEPSDTEPPDTETPDTETPDTETPDTDQSWVRNNAALIAGGIGSVAGGGYLIRRRRRSADQSQEGSSPPASDASTSGTTEANDQSTTTSEEPTADSESTTDRHRTAAEAAIETAITAKLNENLDEAVEAYSRAISEYQAALDTLNAGTTEQRDEIEAAIESTRDDLKGVKLRRKKLNETIEAIKPAERSLQEAVAAYIQDDQTVARIRFRQARDTFEDAHRTITESEDDLLTEPVAVDVQPDREPPSTTLTELPVVSEAEVTALAEAGIETVDDLDSSPESPWTPAAVEELVANRAIEEDTATALTLLSWWHGDESYTFETAEEIERRQQQADYGFNQSS